MRTFSAALAGLGTTVVLSMLAALFGSRGFEGGFALLGVSIYMMIAVTLGGIAAAKVQNTSRAISAFAVLQLFASFPETSWLMPRAHSGYRLIVLVLVIPCAALGGKLGGAPVTRATPNSAPETGADG
ncbi:MAG TPA: hypothetical protein VD771_02420 [Gemmatimonadaceae bacterium]|nr:hypothetical protein [Gemmatimonadaceae bacterium]